MSEPQAEVLPLRQPGSATAAGVKKPETDLLLWACRLLNVVTAGCAVLCAVALGIAIALHARYPEDLFEFTGQTVRVAGILIAVLIMLVETEWSLILAQMPLLDFWIGRGVLQVFEASLTFREATAPEGSSDLHKSLQLYRSVASASLLACAGVYILGGCLCLGFIRKARYRREEQLLKAQADLERLDRRRGELQRLLGRAAQD